MFSEKTSVEPCSVFRMTYVRLLVGDSNIVRFWDAAQVSRRDLAGVTLKSAICLDTLASSMSEVTDALDFVVVSLMSTLAIDEGSAVAVRSTCLSIFKDAVKTISDSAKKSSRVEVRVPLSFFVVIIFLLDHCLISFSFLSLVLSHSNFESKLFRS